VICLHRLPTLAVKNMLVISLLPVYTKWHILPGVKYKTKTKKQLRKTPSVPYAMNVWSVYIHLLSLACATETGCAWKPRTPTCPKPITPPCLDTHILLSLILFNSLIFTFHILLMLLQIVCNSFRPLSICPITVQISIW
jgi:uncharacterized membrane protein